MSTRILIGDCRELLADLPSESVHCCVTSPPYYGLRDYGVDGQIGLEQTLPEYVAEMVAVFREVRRVLRSDGVMWLNLGDSYANDTKWGGSTGGRHAKGLHGQTGIGRERRQTGLPPKSLMGIPWRVALALQDDGWTLRCDVIWDKPNTLPEGSVRDRPTRTHEYLFLFSKSAQYAYDADAIREPHETWAHSNRYAKAYELSGDGQPGNVNNIGIHSRPGNPAGKNRRSIWKISTVPGPGFHFATFPPELVDRCTKSGCPLGGTVIDPFAGSGTTGLVADQLGRHSILIELNPLYAEMARHRIDAAKPTSTQLALLADIA